MEQKQKYLCVKCKEELKELNKGFSIENIFATPQMYCNNNKCVHYGLLTVAGIKAVE